MILLRNIPRVISSHRMVPSLKVNCFYIFEELIIFCKWHRVFSIAYWRDGKKSVVSSFENRYPNLVYGCLVDLNGDDLKVIRQSLRKCGNRVYWGYFIGVMLHVYLKYYQKDK